MPNNRCCHWMGSIIFSVWIVWKRHISTLHCGIIFLIDKLRLQKNLASNLWHRWLCCGDTGLFTSGTQVFLSLNLLANLLPTQKTHFYFLFKSDESQLFPEMQKSCLLSPVSIILLTDESQSYHRDRPMLEPKLLFLLPAQRHYSVFLLYSHLFHSTCACTRT